MDILVINLIKQAFRIGFHQGREYSYKDKPPHETQIDPCEQALQDFIDTQNIERRSERRDKL